MANHPPTTSGDAPPPPTDTASPEIDLANPPFPLTAIDRALLATPDADFTRITWPALRAYIATNRLEELKRLPSDLKRYLAWSHDVKTRYGSITAFVVRERLRWEPLDDGHGGGGGKGTPRFEHRSAVPFADERDFAVLVNDWPYGLEAGIAHLLVWSKTPIAVEAERGDVTEESRRTIVEFVERRFVREVEGGWERVLWFKNWVSLQSVRGVDHVHVMVRDAPREALERWTRRRDL